MEDKDEEIKRLQKKEYVLNIVKHELEANYINYKNSDDEKARYYAEINKSIYDRIRRLDGE